MLPMNNKHYLHQKHVEKFKVQIVVMTLIKVIMMMMNGSKMIMVIMCKLLASEITFLHFRVLIIFKVEPTIATHEQQQSSSSSKVHGKVPSANSRNNDEDE